MSASALIGFGIDLIGKLIGPVLNIILGYNFATNKQSEKNADVLKDQLSVGHIRDRDDLSDSMRRGEF